MIRAISQLDETLDKLETMFLRRQSFLCGHDVTLADLLAVCELMQVSLSDIHQPHLHPHPYSCVNLCVQPVGGGRDVLQGRPRLQSWRSRVQEAVGDAFDTAHAVLYALRDRRRAKL